jgi:tRNA dimethylallyltransferase
MIDAVLILGPTASGKSGLGMRLARAAGGEIVSVDSRQAYRRIDIGTAKPTAAERSEIPHHLIDIIELDEKNDAESFAARAHAAIRDIRSRGKLPILVGGSGLYCRAITQGFFRVDLDGAKRIAFEESLRGISGRALHDRLAAVDPDGAGRIHPNDRYRIVRALEVYELTGVPLGEHFKRQEPAPGGGGTRFLKVGISPPRPELHRMIHERIVKMFDAGWAEEVRTLLGAGADPAWPGLQTLGYPQVVAFVTGKAGLEETIRRVTELTRQYAKRQVTWFRKETGVRWFASAQGNTEQEVIGLLRLEAPRQKD